MIVRVGASDGRTVESDNARREGGLRVVRGDGGESLRPSASPSGSTTGARSNHWGAVDVVDLGEERRIGRGGEGADRQHHVADPAGHPIGAWLGGGEAGSEEGDDSVFEGVPEEDVVGSYPAEDRTFDSVRND